MTQAIAAPKRHRGAWPIVFAALAMAHFYWLDSPITIGIDSQQDKCLPDLHVALMVRQNVAETKHGDLLFWKPQGALSGVKQQYVLKQVAGLPGDKLLVKNEQVFINGKLVAEGLPLIDRSRLRPEQFDREEIIPEGMVFMRGTHPRSNDSRYWGYLPLAQVTGKAWEIF